MARDADESRELDEDPSPDDVERFSGVTQKCPECGSELYDDVAVCWNCGHAMSEQVKPPAWLAIAAIAVLAAFALGMVLYLTI